MLRTLWTLIFVGLAISALAQVPPRRLQAEKEFYGKPVATPILHEGFDSRAPFPRAQIRVQPRKNLQPEDLSESVRHLFKSGLFEDVGYRLRMSPTQDKFVEVTFVVRPYPRIKRVRVVGPKKSAREQILEEDLTLRMAEPLDPYKLEHDRLVLERKYRKAGHHFATVRHEIRKVGRDVDLIWHIFEGPRVQVNEIRVFGTDLDPDDVTGHMVTETWGVFAKGLFNRDLLYEDMERIKFNLRLEGYLDIHHGDRVFVQDIRFSEDKEEVDIDIFVEEGPLYTIRNIRFKGNTLLNQEILHRAAGLFVGDAFSERQLYRSILKLQEKYGEFGHINAKVRTPWFIVEGGHTVNVVFEIDEGRAIRYGRVLVEGNWKTRENRIRLDLRSDVIPGTTVNMVRLNRAVQRLRDRGWFEFGPSGVQSEFLPTGEEDVQDLRLRFEEGRTARIQFAAGFSSSFGVLGVLEYTQRNFDLADFPGSFSELGNAFSGGGQSFSIRLSPGAQRSTYTISFNEPYFFGSNLGFQFNLFDTSTTREDWDEARGGGAVGISRRFEHVSLGLSFRSVDITIEDLEPDAPSEIVELAGRNRINSISPSLAVDTRDSFVVPTRGVRFELAGTYAHDDLGSDFNFYRIVMEVQSHARVYETAARKHHWISTKFALAWAEAFGETFEVPSFERLFAGGRGTLRGFEFRGVGPKEDGSPIGGDVRALVTVEYSVPLYQNTVVGALFVDAGMVSTDWETIRDEKVRVTVGFGFRFIVPTFGNIPIALDFGFAIASEDEDDEQVVLFDLGRFF